MWFTLGGGRALVLALALCTMEEQEEVISDNGGGANHLCMPVHPLLSQ